MKEDLTRRDFLRAAGVAAAGIAGGLAASTSAGAQGDDAKKDGDEGKDEGGDYDDLFGDDGSGGEETRACPQCGALMYRQGRTWTCENCGYSYVE